MTMMRTQKRTTEINFSSFTKEFAKIVFDNAENDINKKECSAQEIKGLTTDIMKYVSNDGNVELMNRIAAKVESWSKDKTLPWKKSLAEYGRTHDDIIEVYCGVKEGKNKFIIVTDTSDSDIVLQHNDFCFELFDTYGDIADFMVLDENEYQGMSEYCSGFRKIYQRG